MNRFIEMSIAVFVCLLFFGPCLLVAAIISATSNGPVIYWSERVGRGGKIFLMPKFRTMKIDTPVAASARLINPDQYITSVGKYLRKTSFDELPQLWCVIVGDMSLVGPRPVLTTETDLISLRNSLGISSLKPGITGWAQINGRDDVDIAAKAAFDAEYLKRKSGAFDLYILWKTIFYVLKKEGVRH